MKIKERWIVGVMTLLILLSACNTKVREIRQIEQQHVFSLRDSHSILLDGVINTRALDDFEALYAANPTVKTVYIRQCDGSINDEVNLQLASRVHALQLNTHLMDDGLVASGGTDFFLAGKQRTMGKNTKVGVHSWAGDGVVATDFPEGHPNHSPYIEYYKNIGFSEAEAKAFYYFTIHAAPADSIHWMTKHEIATYHILSTHIK